MDLDDLTEFAGYLHLQRPPSEQSDEELSVEDKLINALGKPD